MLFCRVTEMSCETVDGVLSVVFAHQAVAGDLGDNRRRADDRHARVAMLYRPRRNRQAQAMHAIHENYSGCRTKRVHGPLHRHQRRLQNVAAVDLLCRADSDRVLQFLRDATQNTLPAPWPKSLWNRGLATVCHSPGTAPRRPPRVRPADRVRPRPCRKPESIPARTVRAPPACRRKSAGHRGG